jgi:aspartate racemase
MKTVGIVGGIGPESTIDYYRFIIAAWREQTQDGSYPSIIINSIDLAKLISLLRADSFAEVTEYLLAGVQRLDRAGADFAVIAANAAHVVFDALRDKSPIPLISIVEATRQDASSRGLKRVGLFGNKFTTQRSFYIDKFKEAGITLVVPSLDEQEYIHEKYFDELVHGVFLAETRNGLLAIAERLRVQEGIEGLILGGTEIPLILRDASDQGIPFLDTTMIHAREIVAQLLAANPH